MTARRKARARGGVDRAGEVPPIPRELLAACEDSGSYWRACRRFGVNAEARYRFPRSDVDRRTLAEWRRAAVERAWRRKYEVS